MNKQFFWSNKKDVEFLKEKLHQNAIIITDTDTIPGFLGNLTQKSFDALCALKQERGNKPFLTLVKDIDSFVKFVDRTQLSEKVINFLQKIWTGAITVIAKAKHEVPRFLTTENRTIAIRCPQHDGLQKVLHDFPGLLSTSANQSGKASPNTIDEIDSGLLQQVSMVMRDEKKNRGDTPQASTIIDITTEPFTVIRHGAVPEQKLREIYESI